MFYSKSTLGFYEPSINTLMPDDVIEISGVEHAELLMGQAKGKVIASEGDGYPILIDPPPPPPEYFAKIERAWRDSLLASTDGVVTRHRDEADAGIATTLTGERYAEIQDYRRMLRDWPQGAEFPQADHRPVAPAWLSGQLK